jgi:hypothetical protein
MLLALMRDDARMQPIRPKKSKSLRRKVSLLLSPRRTIDAVVAASNAPVKIELPEIPASP